MLYVAGVDEPVPSTSTVATPIPIDRSTTWSSPRHVTATSMPPQIPSGPGGTSSRRHVPSRTSVTQSPSGPVLASIVPSSLRADPYAEPDGVVVAAQLPSCPNRNRPSSASPRTIMVGPASGRSGASGGGASSVGSAEARCGRSLAPRGSQVACTAESGIAGTVGVGAIGGSLRSRPGTPVTTANASTATAVTAPATSPRRRVRIVRARDRAAAAACCGAVGGSMP